MTLPEFSIRQTVFVNVLFFVCLLGGLAAMQRIPTEFYPDVTLNSVDVHTVWIGASAEEVERLVTQRLEEELRGVAAIDEMRSTSQADLSEISIDIDEMLDPVEYEAALNDVRAAIDRVDDLPPDAEEPELFEIVLSETQPALILALVDAGGVGETALREVARDARERLADLPGVHRAALRGERDRELRVVVDRDSAARYGLSVLEVSERIRRQNLNLPAGTFRVGKSESTLRARGDYQSVSELLATVVRENPNGTYLRLSDVARVEHGLEKRRFINRHDGKPAQIITLTKKSGFDVMRLAASVDVWMDGHRRLLPDGVELYKALDTAEFVKPRTGILRDNLIAGVFLVMAILWFTIGFRNAALTIVAIPFSFLTAMMLFPMLGITINSMTLIAMLLVSGMLVDDAIIVLENIYRRIEEGAELRRAVVEGANEVLWPVVCAVATTCAAFAPLLLVGGTSGKFVEALPKAVIVCLSASLFECLVILPAHYLDFGSRQQRGADSPGGNRGFGGVFSRVGAVFLGVRNAVDSGLDATRSAYVRSLDSVLAHRGVYGLLALALFFFAFAASRHLPVELFPGEFDTFNVLLETPTDFALDQTDAINRQVEGVLLPFVESETVEGFTTTVGLSVDSNYDRLRGNNLSMTFLVLSRTDAALRSPESVMLEVRDRVQAWREQNPDGVVELRVQAEQDGPPIGSPVEVRVHGDDYALGKAIAGEMKAYLSTLPGVYNIEDNLKLGSPEVRVIVDEERAARHGLGFEDLARALRGANDGIVATSFRDPSLDEDIDIRVLLEEGDRSSLQDLLEIELRTPAGYLLRLRDVADVEVTRGFRAYRRYDGRRTVSVYADVDEAVTTSVAVNQRLKAHFADIEQRYPEVEVRYGGEFEETQEAFANLFAVFPVAFLAIYMILAALFRSYVQPLIVTAAIPFGLMGIVLGVGAMGYSVSFVLLYSTIGLTGVVVNDSLVMVDFINRARRDGLPLLEAVRLSGARRFRPILLTTLTTVLALLPMALGLQGESKTYGPFAASISFGLIVAMAGTLYAVPSCYTSLLVWQERIERRWTAWRRGTTAAPLEDAG